MALPAHAFEVQIPAEPVVEGAAFFVIIKTEPYELLALSPGNPVIIKGRFQRRPVEFFKDEHGENDSGVYTALLGVEFGTQTSEEKLKITITSGTTNIEKEVSISVVKGTFPSEELKVKPGQVKLSKADESRNAKDMIAIRKVHSQVTLHRFWDRDPVMPIDSKVTSVYGTNRVFNGQMLSSHLGTDLRAKVPTKIKAPVGGLVAFARNTFRTGNTIILDHGFGFFSLYAHLSKFKVKEGQLVTRGSIVGISGNTGRTTAPHLHWGVRVQGIRVDPLSVMDLLKNKVAGRVVASPK